MAAVSLDDKDMWGGDEDGGWEDDGEGGEGE